MKKLTYEFVKGYFKEQGCKLMEEEYKNNYTKMRYRCECGNISIINYRRFKQGQRCMECSGDKKYSLQYIQNYFKENGCKLLEEKYKNNKSPLKYKCSCGNISKISFNCFKNGQRCKKCGGTEKYTFNFVKQNFKENECKLLEKIYKNSHTLMRYKCNCGNISKITFDSFKRGHRCMKCASAKRSGEKSGKWNPNLTNEEREANKNRTSDYLYIKWRIKIYNRDNYICQKCSQRGYKLNAHHIKNYSDNKNLRLVKSNGITFCEKHHKEFHSVYGYRNTNKQQLDEFLT